MKAKLQFCNSESSSSQSITCVDRESLILFTPLILFFIIAHAMTLIAISCLIYTLHLLYLCHHDEPKYKTTINDFMFLGKMFAFVAIMEDLCTLTASILFNSIYPLTRPILKGFIFLLAAGLLVIPLVIMM